VAQTIEVCLAPPLLPHRLTASPSVVVLVDVIRASTTVCAALLAGAPEVRLIADLVDLWPFREKDYWLAAERMGHELYDADFGNRPSQFTPATVQGRPVALSTTNGTQLISTCTSLSPEVRIGSFCNLDLLAQHLRSYPTVLVACAGWKNQPCLEDTAFGGALVLALAQSHQPLSDSTQLAYNTYFTAVQQLRRTLRYNQSRERIERLGLQNDVKQCLRTNGFSVVPRWRPDIEAFVA
jgi:2-phosphosulfolactate phosphatase